MTTTTTVSTNGEHIVLNKSNALLILDKTDARQTAQQILALLGVAADAEQLAQLLEQRASEAFECAGVEGKYDDPDEIPDLNDDEHENYGAGVAYTDAAEQVRRAAGLL